MIVRTVFLIAGWCALWRDISVANVLSGLIVIAAVYWIVPETRSSGRIRLRPLASLTGLVAQDLARSTISVASEVLTPTDYTQELTAPVRIPAESRRHMLALTVLITLTPGTAVIDTDPDQNLLLLHLLHADRLTETLQHVEKLTELLAATFPESQGPLASLLEERAQ